ncbi:MAG: FadR/GntR family transcriptional regulator [Clostridia bacterium]|nr:FadR/GntR family transcriptional regulator [Clostridia bacterium]
MMNIDENEKSLPEKLSDDIVKYILNKQMKPGDRLPNESILAKEMGAGRSSVREAMKLLASRNIVNIKQGSGTYIANSTGVVEDPLGFTFINDKKKLTWDLLEIRFLIEPYIAQTAALNADDEDIKIIEELCNEVEYMLNKGIDHVEKDIEFHKAIAKSSKNLVVPRLIPIINSSIPLFVEITNNILKDETIETHREITQAIKEHNPVKANDAMYMHLVYNRRVIQSKNNNH